MKELTLRVGPAVCLPEIARQFGKDPAPASAAAGLDEALVADPEYWVSIFMPGKFAAEIAKLKDRPNLGLLVAMTFGQHSLGLVLLLAQEGPNVRTSLLNTTPLSASNSRAGRDSAAKAVSRTRKYFHCQLASGASRQWS